MNTKRDYLTMLKTAAMAYSRTSETFHNQSIGIARKGTHLVAKCEIRGRILQAQQFISQVRQLEVDTQRFSAAFDVLEGLHAVGTVCFNLTAAEFSAATGLDPDRYEPVATPG